jgi:hypothetical protein
MKEQIKNKSNGEIKQPEMVFTVDHSLDKYSGPEFDPPKLKKVKERFSKGVIIHR